MSAVSSTFLSTLRHALREGRDSALVEICEANLGLASNRSGQELKGQVDGIVVVARIGHGLRHEKPSNIAEKAAR